MNNLEAEIKKRLSEKRLYLSDISILISQHTKKAKEKTLIDAGKIVSEDIPKDNEDVCKEWRNF